MAVINYGKWFNATDNQQSMVKTCWWDIVYIIFGRKTNTLV